MYAFPIPSGDHERARGSIEGLKRDHNFEEVITHAIAGRVLRITGWPFEVWHDRRPLIEDALRKFYNPRFCDAVCVSDPSRYHDMVGEDVEDSKAPLSRKGHDEIRRAMGEIIRQVYPALDKKQREGIRRGCETLLFFFLKNTLQEIRR